MPGFRVGTGYDSHRFDAERPLVLGGVAIPDHPGLSGHSDADAVAHAVTDAILGAVAAGDIGTHFPPTDDRWKGADSIGLLRRAAEIVKERGYRVGNVDVTVVCESPKIGPRASAMARRLGDAIGVPPGSVSVKGKSNEGLGWIGRGEGIAVHAVAIVARISTPESAED
ncbi:MAG: 2-C-methyl-D-erythritol 2,4-cyclodiphosphate synthase [Gemmatimonadetes bacterium]|nr:2-C-methyl-D-erythritol 2,4-cyclodiphosphate synthase [Gemmatimonadota bacterium]NNF12873.1 2-C-methyl-D-erythritol 2,4-cyclodiphosphate synthase [Gemmatimonadota bacterium]